MFVEDVKIVSLIFIRMLKAKCERKRGSVRWKIKRKKKKKKRKSRNLTNLRAKTGRITVDAARNLRDYSN